MEAVWPLYSPIINFNQTVIFVSQHRKVATKYSRTECKLLVKYFVSYRYFWKAIKVAVLEYEVGSSVDLNCTRSQSRWFIVCKNTDP